MRCSPSGPATVHDQANGVHDDRSVVQGLPFAASGQCLSRRLFVAVASQGFNEDTPTVVRTTTAARSATMTTAFITSVLCLSSCSVFSASSDHGSRSDKRTTTSWSIPCRPASSAVRKGGDATDVPVGVRRRRRAPNCLMRGLALAITSSATEPASFALSLPVEEVVAVTLVESFGQGGTEN